jgi:hypothetical protein
VSTQPSSTEVKLAAVLMGTAAGFGVLVVMLGVRLLSADDFLMFVLPMVGIVLATFGFFVTGSAVITALALWRCKPGARLQTALVGGGLVVSGMFVLMASPAVGLVLTLYGGTLLFLMTTAGAARDLGPWVEHLKQPAPWGTRPGGLWSKAEPQQGPWAPDPTTIPWLSWKDHSGPRPPWWQTWRAGLAQGIPLWELVLLVLALLCFAVGLVAIPFHMTGSHWLGNLGWSGSALWFMPIPVAIGIVAWLEQRMRRRLAVGR